MRCRALLGVMGVLGCMLLAVAAEADLDRLVRQLGSDSFSDREAAMKALDDIGLPALPALKKAAQSLDAETRRRAEELVARIEKRQESARLLAPTKVSLQLQDVPLPEAVAELAKLSGQPVKLGGDVSKLAERKVSLEFKEVPFWEALDRFCRVASLAEATTVNSPMAPRQPGEPRPRGRRPVLTPNPKEPCIMLVDGKPGNEPTHFAGAARIRALPVTTQVLDVPRNPGEIVFALGLGLEAKSPLQKVVGVRVERAVDERGQTLEALPVAPVAQNPDGALFLRNFQGMAMASVATIGQQQAPIRLKAGEQPSQLLKELTGTVRIELLTPPEPLITVDDVLKSAGKNFNGTNGGSLTVQDVKREEDGQVKMQVELSRPNDMNGGNVQIQGQGQMIVQIGGNIIAGQPGADLGLALLDAQGRPFQLVSNPIRQWKINNNQVSHELTLHFKPQAGQGEPAKLVHSGTRIAQIEIPFSLQDVPLPAR